MAVREGQAFGVLPPDSFPDKIFKQQPSSQDVDWTRAAAEYADFVLRGREIRSGLERSNYSACIYFEKHAGAIIYSQLRHFLE